jgi:hypothetical protein
VDILQSLDADFGIKINELRYGDAKLTDISPSSSLGRMWDRRVLKAALISI